MKFEAHITMPRSQSDTVQRHAETMLLYMTFSAIDGDPVMGKEPYCYLTCYDTDGERLLAKVKEASRVLAQSGVTILREKVERIVYDTKTGVNEFGLVPRCTECGADVSVFHTCFPKLKKACSHDTDGDGNCGRPLCPECGGG